MAHNLVSEWTTFQFCNMINEASWVYPTEVFPLASRSKGAALATFAFSIAGGSINMIIPYLIDAIGFWVFILFALINLAMLAPIYLFYAGKSLCLSLAPLIR